MSHFFLLPPPESRTFAVANLTEGLLTVVKSQGTRVTAAYSHSPLTLNY